MERRRHSSRQAAISTNHTMPTVSCDWNQAWLGLCNNVVVTVCQPGGLIGFADSDFANDPGDRKSVSGYVFQLYGNTISWKSKKRPRKNASSTLEAELYAISYASKHLLWIQEGLSELQENSQPEPVVLYGDNQGTLQLIQNEKINDLTKHVAVTYHYMRNLVLERRCFGLEYVASSDNLADICGSVSIRGAVTIITDKIPSFTLYCGTSVGEQCRYGDRGEGSCYGMSTSGNLSSFFLFSFSWSLFLSSRCQVLHS